MKIHVLNGGDFKTDGGAMFGVVPKIMWSKHVKADAENYIEVVMRSLLIETKDRLILFDAAAGKLHDQKKQKIYRFSNKTSIPDALNKFNYSPKDITDVILTHLHYDHCGGLIEEDKEIFSSATFHVSAKHWENANNPNIRESAAFDKNILDYLKSSGRLNLFEEGKLFPNIEIKLFYGHTKGLAVPIISIKDKKIIFASDLIPSSLHVSLPYIAAFDICAEKVIEEKHSLYQNFEKENFCILLEHDQDTECVKISLGEKGYTISRKLTLKEFINS